MRRSDRCRASAYFVFVLYRGKRTRRSYIYTVPDGGALGEPAEQAIPRGEKQSPPQKAKKKKSVQLCDKFSFFFFV